jgi:hypothetical protein
MPMCRAPAGAARHPQGRGAHALRALREAAAAAVDHEVAFRGGVSDPSNIALPAVTGRIDPPWGAERRPLVSGRATAASPPSLAATARRRVGSRP